MLSARREDRGVWMRGRRRGGNVFNFSMSAQRGRLRECYFLDIESTISGDVHLYGR